MDVELRRAERSGNVVAWLRNKMRAGEVSQKQAILLSYIGHPEVMILVNAPVPPCKGNLCLGHLAMGIEDAGPEYVQLAKVTAQKMWTDELDRRCRKLGWNQPGENETWLLMQRELKLLAAMREGKDHAELKVVLVDVADDLTYHPSMSNDSDVREAVVKALTERVLG